MTESSAQQHVDRRVLAYYGEEFDEDDRLVGRSGQGRLELERTQQVVRERVAAGSRIIDVGGGSGVHAAALVARGDRVLLVDPVPRHVAAARARGVDAVRGDARSLPAPDRSFDAALLLGPLYHLVDRTDRVGALREAARVVRPGGWVFAAAVSRLSALAWVAVIRAAVLGPTATPLGPQAWRLVAEQGAGELGPHGFPGGHFHLAEDLEREVADAGLEDVSVIGLEGPGGQALDVSRSHDPGLVEAARTLAEAFESHPGLRDLSPHLLATARVPESDG